ncbi:MAG: transporter substrate-binding domain-containing protein [Bacteroidota bacterium]
MKDTVNPNQSNLFRGGWVMILMTFLILPASFLTGTSSSAISGAMQYENTQEPIIVGCEKDYPPFCFVNENGEADGFSVELFRAAANEMGLTVDFKVGAWNKLKYDLEDGKLDALPLVGRTPERENMYDFTFPYLTMHGTIVVRENEKGIQSLDDLQGKDVAVMKGDNAEEFLNRTDLNTNIIQRTTFKRAMTELSSGEHDAVVIQRLLALELIKENGLNNLRVIEEANDIYQQSFCFAVQEGNEELLSLLNEGLSIVTTNGTYRQLHAKWFAPLESITESQKRIIIGGDKNYPPYEFLDENGQPTGYNVELMRAIADEVGLNIEIQLGPWAEIRQELDNGNIDAIQGILYSPKRDKTFDMSPAHTTINYVITARKNAKLPENLSDLEGQPVLVQKGDLMHDHALKQGLEDELVPVETQEKALRLLNKGKYDFALTSRVLTNYFIKENGWENLTMSNKPIHSAEYCIGVKEGNTALLSKLSDGLAAIKGTGKYHEIHSQWLSVYEEPQFGLRDFLEYTLYILVPLVLALIGSLIWSRNLNKRVSNRTKELQAENAKRKKAQEALKESKETAEKYLNIAAEIILSLDPEGNISLLNDSGHRLLEYEKGELIGKNWFTTCLPEDSQKSVRQIFNKLIQGNTEGVKLIEGPVITKSGERKTILWHNSYLLDKNQRITGLLTSGEDITERKETQRKLKESENFISALLNNINVGVVACNAYGILTYFNKKTQEFHGLPQMSIPPEEWADYYDLFMPDGKTRMEAEDVPLYKALRGEYFNEIEMVIKPANGKAISILASGQPLKDAQGSITGAVVAMYDITERKRAEEQMIELNQKLNQQNEEITAQNEEYETLNEELNEKNQELYNINEELEKAKEKAQESDQLKSAFLANMSHEIRTPMNGIMGFADLLKKPKLSDEKKDYYTELIQKSGERMLNIIGNLLDIAKIEAEQTEIQMKEISVNELLDDLFAMFEPEANKKGLSMTYHKGLSKSEDQLVTDSTKLYQLLTNLINNAIKYTNSGQIKFGYTREDTALRFYISDTGIGISPEMQQKIFERFRRAELETTSEYDGAGLGLSISKAYVEMLGGELWLNSSPGEGSTFYFTLPYRTSHQYDNTPEQAGQNTTRKFPKNITMLVAEDDESNFILIKEMMQDKNITFIRTKDGKETLEKIRNNPDIDLVLMDIKMPLMDGYEATREIKKLRPGLPVIAQTAFASQKDREKAINAGCEGYLAKPIQVNDLMDYIENLVK